MSSDSAAYAGAAHRTRDTVASQARLITLSDGGPGRSYIIGSDAVSVGRDPAATIRIDDSEVSRKHLRIEWNGVDGWVAHDLESRNGTFVNGARVERCALAMGDTIQLGAGVIFVFTRYDRLEEKLQQSQALESVGRLASGVAHDFNNVLSAILLTNNYIVELSRAGRLTHDELSECLDNANQAAQRAASLTHQLLGLSRGAPAEFRRLLLSDVATEVCDLCAQTFPDRVRVEADIAKGLFVQGDSGRLHQVLMNLCVNARDAIRGEGHLLVEAMAIQLDPAAPGAPPFLRPGRYVLVVVSDSGAGMDHETKGKAFEPFFTTKGPGKGTGLGLATAHRIVRDHGGDIQLTSTPGVGTAVRVFLPVGERAVVAGRRIEPTTEVHHVAAVTGRPGDAIIIFDADGPLRLGTARMLRHLGFDALTAANATDAVKLFTAHHRAVRAVLLDASAPSAEAVFEQLRKVDATRPVLVIADASVEGRARGLVEIGAAAVLVKPFDGSELTRALAQTLLPIDQPPI